MGTFPVMRVRLVHSKKQEYLPSLLLRLLPLHLPLKALPVARQPAPPVLLHYLPVVQLPRLQLQGREGGRGGEGKEREGEREGREGGRERGRGKGGKEGEGKRERREEGKRGMRRYVVCLCM